MSNNVRHQGILFLCLNASSAPPMFIYCSWADRLSLIPSSWQIFVTYSVPPVDVGEPVPIIVFKNLYEGFHTRSWAPLIENPIFLCFFFGVVSVFSSLSSFSCSSWLESGSFSILSVFLDDFFLNSASSVFSFGYSSDYLFIFLKQEGLSINNARSLHIHFIYLFYSWFKTVSCWSVCSI